MRDNLVEQIISEVMHKQTDDRANNKTPASFIGCGLTEFVGTALGHTIGLVIANVDHQLHEVMNIDKNIALSVFLAPGPGPARIYLPRMRPLKPLTVKFSLLSWLAIPRAAVGMVA